MGRVPEIRRPALPLQAVEQVARFVQDHHCDGIDVQDLADAAGYSRHHFSRAFKASTAVAPSAYLAAVRIDSAKRLLLSETCAVVDVAVEVGFDSLSSFTRRFATTVGTTPARLRLLAQKLDHSAVAPFTLSDPNQPIVAVTPVLPEGVDDSCRIWLGWYPTPAPIGLPAAGQLGEYDEPMSLPLHPSAPWLLGFVVEESDDHLHELAPAWPVVARHHVPITQPGAVTLTFRRAGIDDIPLLSALPALAK
ncbi:AraC family transcriptional regulator [Luteococcus japonicus]|uniref:AraC family transcriptional regulator n=1 Tax=Luteococcus japonicus TaxID=33984 RepID=A0A3N1ZRR2_9ACTN|nr:AraC family transcriptional regulator [Luteococcus japonicus]